MEISNSMNLLLETSASCHYVIKGEYLQKQIPPFINLAIDEAVKNLQNHFGMLRKTICSSDSYIGFTVGFDATVVVKSWKLLESYGSIIGVSYPNHFLGVIKYQMMKL